MTQSREVHLTSRPQGSPVVTDFEIVKVDIEDPAEGQVLVKNIYLSVDTYMRGRMRFAKPNELLLGGVNTSCQIGRASARLIQVSRGLVPILVLWVCPGLLLMLVYWSPAK